MNIAIMRSVAAWLLLGGLLAGCGGGGNGGATGNPDQETSVALGDNGTLTFPPGSLQAGETVTVQQVPQPALPSGLEPVGDAWLVEMDQQPSLPVQVKLPVPTSEVADGLTLVRIESSGRISILQTRIENGMLVARTPGFSAVGAARKSDTLANIDTEITGPDFLPTNIAGQYTNHTLVSDPAVARKWHVFEHAADMGTQFAVDDRPLWNSSARLSAATAGVVTLMLEFSDATTGLNVVAMKDVSIQPTLASGQTLDIAIYGPPIVKDGEAFDLNALVINTDVTDITRWEWKIRNHSGSCETQCSLRFDISDLHLDSNLGLTQTFEISAYAASGATGTASFDIRVLDNSMYVVWFERSSDDNALVWDKLLNPTPEVSFAAEITGGVPPYTYVWTVLDFTDSEEHIVWETNDSLTFHVTQPGTHKVDLRVWDSVGQTAWGGMQYVEVTGAKPLEYDFADQPSSDVALDQPVSVTLHAVGGVLMRDGVPRNGYPYVINWGDGTDAEDIIPATDPDNGGDLVLEHTYQSVGSYEIRFLVTDALILPTMDDLENINMAELIRTAHVNIVAGGDSITRPSVDVCPSTVIVEENDSGITHTLAIDSLTHMQGGYISLCNYEGQGLSGSADFHISLLYNPASSTTSYFCGRTVNYFAEPLGNVWLSNDYFYSFSNTTLNVWGTQRTVVVSWYQGPGSVISGAITVDNNDEEVMLIETFNRLVDAGFGADCASL